MLGAAEGVLDLVFRSGSRVSLPARYWHSGGGERWHRAGLEGMPKWWGGLSGGGPGPVLAAPAQAGGGLDHLVELAMPGPFVSASLDLLGRQERRNLQAWVFAASAVDVELPVWADRATLSTCPGHCGRGSADPAWVAGAHLSAAGLACVGLIVAKRSSGHSTERCPGTLTGATRSAPGRARPMVRQCPNDSERSVIGNLSLEAPPGPRVAR